MWYGCVEVEPPAEGCLYNISTATHYFDLLSRWQNSWLHTGRKFTTPMLCDSSTGGRRCIRMRMRCVLLLTTRSPHFFSYSFFFLLVFTISTSHSPSKMFNTHNTTVEWVANSTHIVSIQHPAQHQRATPNVCKHWRRAPETNEKIRCCHIIKKRACLLYLCMSWRDLQLQSNTHKTVAIFCCAEG